jgi:hypothetical protein
MTKNKKLGSTVTRWLQNPSFKKAVDKEFKELVLSEMVLAIMAEDSKSVRELANELGLSKTVVQNLRSGNQRDMKLSNFMKFTHAYGYRLVLEKEGSRIAL